MAWRRYLMALGALGALGVSSAVFAETRTTTIEAVSGPGVVDTDTQTDDVRFRTDQGQRMTVPVRLSGTGPYHFLVDTGPDRTAISRDLAKAPQARRRRPGKAAQQIELVNAAELVHIALTNRC